MKDVLDNVLGYLLYISGNHWHDIFLVVCVFFNIDNQFQVDSN